MTGGPSSVTTALVAGSTNPAGASQVTTRSNGVVMRSNAASTMLGAEGGPASLTRI